MEVKLKLGKYRHSKSGQMYELIGVAHHSETLEELVVYRAMYYDTKFGNNPIFVRPLKMFVEVIEIDGRKRPRFEFIPE